MILINVKKDKTIFCQEAIKKLSRKRKDIVINKRINRYNRIYVLLRLIKVILKKFC